MLQVRVLYEGEGFHGHGQVSARKVGEVRFFVQTLGKRQEWVEDIRRQIPELEIMQSVNGLDHEEAERELLGLGLEYHNLGFPNYGVLGCWLTKFKGFEMQARDGIPAACWLEDDLLLGFSFEGLTFRQFVEEEAGKPGKYDILRLGGWGECYVTHLDGATRLVERLRKDGIRCNVDNQLKACNEHCPGIAPYRPRCGTNCGDTLKGRGIDQERLRKLTQRV